MKKELNTHGLEMRGLDWSINTPLAEEGDIPDDCAVEVVYNYDMGKVETRLIHMDDRGWERKVLVGYLTSWTDLQDIADKIAYTVEEAKRKGWLNDEVQGEEVGA